MILGNSTLARALLDSRLRREKPELWTAIQRAEKFIFDLDASKAVHNLVRAHNLIAAIPLCRLPYPLTWIEMIGAGNGADGHFLNDDVRVIGSLIMDVSGGQNTNLIVTLATEFVDGKIVLQAVATRLKLSGTITSFEDCLEILKNPFFSKDERDEVSLDKIHGDAYAQLNAEIVLSAIALINTKNGVATEPGTHLYTRRERRRENKPALSYTTVKLKLSRRETRMAEAQGMTHAEIREHMVRGHRKIRKTGIFWWRPFKRGNPEAGRVVHKEYDVTE